MTFRFVFCLFFLSDILIVFLHIYLHFSFSRIYLHGVTCFGFHFVWIFLRIIFAFFFVLRIVLKLHRWWLWCRFRLFWACCCCGCCWRHMTWNLLVVKQSLWVFVKFDIQCKFGCSNIDFCVKHKTKCSSRQGTVGWKQTTKLTQHFRQGLIRGFGQLAEARQLRRSNYDKFSYCINYDTKSKQL